MRFFWQAGEVHPIRGSQGYEDSKAHRHGKRTAPAKRGPKQTTLPKPTRAQREQLAREERAYRQAQRAAERAAKEKARRDAQAKRAQEMWERWERNEDEKKAKAALREARRLQREREKMEDEEARERKRMTRERKRAIYSFLKGGVRPGARDVRTEYRLYVPKQYRRQTGMPADEVAALMHSNAPWLGVHSESDLYDALRAVG